jgi:hypothetical protein
MDIGSQLIVIHMDSKNQFQAMNDLSRECNPRQPVSTGHAGGYTPFRANG